MALEMKDRLYDLRSEWRNKYQVEINVRMGMNTGYCTVGNVGSRDRYDYTAVGGQVSHAIQIESSAENNQILISESTYVLVREFFECREKGEVILSDLVYPLRSYEVLETLNYDNGSKPTSVDLADAIRLEYDLNQIRKKELLSQLKNSISELERLSI